MSAERFSEKGIVPDGTIATTLGIDSQSDGFFWVLSCWGRKSELWLPLTSRIVGDMRSEEPWNELEEILSTTWLDAVGNAYKPVCSAIDVQGDNYSQVLEFVRAHGGRLKLKAIRGWSPARGLGAGRTSGILRNVYVDRATHVGVTNIDVDAAKSIFASLLARKNPIVVHLPMGPHGEDKGGWTQGAISELTSEYRRQTSLRGYVITRWHRRSGQPNHRLDCVVYSMGALSLSRLRLETCDVQRIEARNIGKAESTTAASPFGARRMIGARELALDGPPIGGMVPRAGSEEALFKKNFSAPYPQPKRGFGAINRPLS